MIQIHAHITYYLVYSWNLLTILLKHNVSVQSTIMYGMVKRLQRK